MNTKQTFNKLKQLMLDQQISFIDVDFKVINNEDYDLDTDYEEDLMENVSLISDDIIEKYNQNHPNAIISLLHGISLNPKNELVFDMVVPTNLPKPHIQLTTQDVNKLLKS